MENIDFAFTIFKPSIFLQLLSIFGDTVLLFSVIFTTFLGSFKYRFFLYDCSIVYCLFFLKLSLLRELKLFLFFDRLERSLFFPDVLRSSVSQVYTSLRVEIMESSWISASIRLRLWLREDSYILVFFSQASFFFYSYSLSLRA